jgi:two-component system CheB/CheR fusion protein
VLATAREGRYPTAIEADVSEDRLQRFFTREGDHYRIKKEVRDLVVFAAHSLLKDPPFSKLDLISCRNLLIYLERELQNQVCTSFHYALKPGRFLFLGSAETADGVPGQFRAADRERRIYQAVEGFATSLAPRLLLTPQAPILPASRPIAREGAPIEASVHLSALEDMAPPSAIVDDEHRVVNLSESAGRFLQPSGGQISTAITHLARSELRLDLRTGLHRAFEKGEGSLSLPIPVRFNGSTHRVLLQISPIQRRDHARALALILFIDAGPTSVEAEPALAASGSDEMIRQLQQELQLTRERLKASREEYEATNEELRAANEELQSINEEYRSTAEELETSKEELQSMNEELQTLNAELKMKLEGVSRAHSDLQNLMAATEVGTLFLDTGLRIKRFTPRVAELFNITIGDEGRPITDFTHRLSYDNLEQDARTVLRDLAPQEREAESKAGRWYLMRLRPYRTVDDKIDGVVVTFVDVTERRRTEQRLLQLTAELDHRVKNILARVGVMIERSRETAQTADELAVTLRNRIQSMADTHSMLSKTQWHGANLRQLCGAELSLYSQGDNVSISAPDMMLNARAAQSYSMVLHELTTNAVKHGALSRAGGKVVVEFVVLPNATGDRLRLRWTEAGGPEPSSNAYRSYGLQTIEELLAYELAAEAKVELRKTGLFAEFTTLLSQVEAAAS